MFTRPAFFYFLCFSAFCFLSWNTVEREHDTEIRTKCSSLEAENKTLKAQEGLVNRAYEGYRESAALLLHKAFPDKVKVVDAMLDEALSRNGGIITLKGVAEVATTEKSK